MLCGTGDALVSFSVTLPAAAASESSVNLSWPLGSAATATVVAPAAGAVAAGAVAGAVVAGAVAAGAVVAGAACPDELLLEPQAASPSDSAVRPAAARARMGLRVTSSPPR